DGERLRFVLEEDDVLRLAVVGDGELILIEGRHQASLAVEHGGRHGHDLGRCLECRGLLLGGGRQCGSGEKCDGRKAPHGITLSDLETPRRVLWPGWTGAEPE